MRLNSSTYLFISTIITAVISFTFQTIILLFLGNEIFSEMIVLISYYTLFSFIFNFLTLGSAQAFLNKSTPENNINRWVVINSLRIFFLFSCGSFIFLVIFGGLIQIPLHNDLFTIITFSLVEGLRLLLLNFILGFAGFKTYSFVEISRSLIQISSLFFFIFLKVNPSQIPKFSLFLSIIAPVIILIILCSLILNRDGNEPKKSQFLPFIFFGLFSSIIIISNAALANIDKILLKQIIPLEDFSLYSYIYLLTLSISTTILPILKPIEVRYIQDYSKFGSKERLKVINQTLTPVFDKFLLSVLITVPFIAEWLSSILFFQKQEFKIVFSLLAAFFIFMTFFWVQHRVYIAINKLYISGSILLSGIVLYLILTTCFVENAILGSLIMLITGLYIFLSSQIASICLNIAEIDLKRLMKFFLSFILFFLCVVINISLIFALLMSIFGILWIVKIFFLEILDYN